MFTKARAVFVAVTCLVGLFMPLYIYCRGLEAWVIRMWHGRRNFRMDEIRAVVLMRLFRDQTSETRYVVTVNRDFPSVLMLGKVVGLRSTMWT